MSENRWRLDDPEETQLFGSKLAKYLRPGLLVTLKGDLGAGKTTLAKGLIADITKLDPDDVTSPTFCLSLDYDEGPFLIRHIDAYRLGGSEALVDLGFLDWCEDSKTLVILEWPERVPDALPCAYLEISLNLDRDGRVVSMETVGAGLDEIISDFALSWAQRNNNEEK
jgi:tRNA threonylcarbamoyl adenosine modification protein YjeE